MKKIWLMFLMLFAMACSAPMSPEVVGEVQEEVGTCPRPIGSCGDTVWPVDSYVSAIGVDPTASWRLLVKNKLVASPYTVTTCYVDFGGVDSVNSQAKITGWGWSSGAGRKVERVLILNSSTAQAQSLGCWNTGVLHHCLLVAETGDPTPFPILDFDGHWSGPNAVDMNTGNRLTAIVGPGTGNQRLMFYYDDGAAPLKSRFTTFSGPKLDACLYP